MRLAHLVPCPGCSSALLDATGGGATCLNADCAIMLTCEQLKRWESLRAQGARGEVLLRLGALGEILQVGPRMKGVRERIHKPIYDSLVEAKSESERIVAAALLVDGKVWSLPAPARHHHLILHYCAETGEQRIPRHDQGFVTSTDRFVRRAPAALLAFRAGQIAELKNLLYSEDVW